MVFPRSLKVIRIYILLLSLTYCLYSNAQYDVHFSHYWAMDSYFNPAAVGKTDKLNVTAAYSMSLVGFENNPQTFYAGGDIPFYFLNSTHGVGVVLMNDDIGLFTHKNFAVQYAFHKNLFGGSLGIGVKLGLLSEGFNGTDLDLETPDDPAFPTADVTGNSMDIGLGVYYSRGDLYAGLSAQHINSPRVEIGEKQEIDVSSSYYFTAGYNIRLRNPFLSIQSSMLASTDGVAWRVDLGGRLTYTNDKRKMYAGLSYSPANSVSLMVGGDFHGVQVGYCYEAYTTAMSLGNGGHEIFIGYQTTLDLGKKGKNLHKSVRLL